MENKFKKAWTWVKENKELIIGTGLMVVGGAALIAVGIKYRPDKRTGSNDPAPNGIIPNWGVGDCCNYETYGEGKVIEFWLDNVNIEDTGKLGEEIISKIPNLPDNAKMWAIVNISEKTN
jgi:hypothetical protein